MGEEHVFDKLSESESLVLKLIAAEFIAARKFSAFGSEHEGYAVILEEVDELWDAIKANKITTEFARMREAVQVGAMAMKFVDSCANTGTLNQLAVQAGVREGY